MACSFHGTPVRRHHLTECKLTGSVFADCAMRAVTVTGGDFTAVSLGGADLRGLDFSG